MTNPGDLSRVIGLAERLEVLARELINAKAQVYNLQRQLIDTKAEKGNLERQLAFQGRVLDDMDMRIAALEAWDEYEPNRDAANYERLMKTGPPK